MRAARLYGTADLRVGEEPTPEAGAGETLVRVTAVGICGSDLHWYSDGAIGDAKLEWPLVPGHEGAGEIAAGPRRGERVAIDPAIPCETCRACRDGYRNLCYNIRFSGHGTTDGMMREVMPWPSRLLRPLPDTVSDEGGAMLEPLGVALWALDLGHVPFGGTVAVVGCGPIGLLLIQLLRAAGVSRVLAVEPLAHRREAAATWGADLVIAPPLAPAQPAPAQPAPASPASLRFAASSAAGETPSPVRPSPVRPSAAASTSSPESAAEAPAPTQPSSVRPSAAASTSSAGSAAEAPPPAQSAAAASALSAPAQPAASASSALAAAPPSAAVPAPASPVPSSNPDISSCGTDSCSSFPASRPSSPSSPAPSTPFASSAPSPSCPSSPTPFLSSVSRPILSRNPDISSYGADVAFEFAGNDEGVRIAMESVRPGGRVVLGGIPDFDTTTFRASLARRKGLTIAMVRRMNEVYPRAIDLAARGVVSLDPLVSSRVPLDSAPEAFAAAERRSGLKVIIAP